MHYISMLGTKLQRPHHQPMTPTESRSAPPAPAIGQEPADAEFLAALGRQVREARERRGMARKAFSQNADVSERYLAQLEAGEGNVSVLLLRNVARALGV